MQRGILAYFMRIIRYRQNVSGYLGYRVTIKLARGKNAILFA